MGQLASGFTAGLKGEASNPAYSFLDAAQTGFFLNSAGDIVFCRAGVEVLRVTSTGLQVARSKTMTFETGAAFGTTVVGNTGITGKLSITDNSANTLLVTSTATSALVIGPNGATNPVLKVVSGAVTVDTGLSITGTVAGNATKLAVLSSAANEDLLVDAKGSGSVSLSSVSTGVTKVGSALIVTSAAAAAFDVGRLGTTTPSFRVVGNVGTAITGVAITGRASGAGASLAVISSSTNEKLTIDSLGSGLITIGSTSTGMIVLGRGVSKTHLEKLTVASITTAGSGSYTAANLVGGVINRDPNGASRTDTLDTAVNIIAAMAGGGATGDTFKCMLINTADAAETITLAGDTGTTIVNIGQTLAQNEAATLLIVQTGAATVDVYVIGA